jgi:hypothetical protein
VNRTETSQLLTLIARYDNRRVDDATVIAWHAVLGDLEPADCQAAVIRHVGTSDAYLMPVHIRRLAEEIDRERRKQIREAREVEQAAIEAADPTRRDRSEHVRALIAQLRTELPEGDPDSLRYASKHWRQVREARERQENAEPNPHFDPEALKRLSELEPPE